MLVQRVVNGNGDTVEMEHNVDHNDYTVRWSIGHKVGTMIFESKSSAKLKLREKVQSMGSKDLFFNTDGTFTKYALCLGYIQSDGGSVVLFREGGTHYVVKDVTRCVSETYHKLADARKAYKRLVNRSGMVGMVDVETTRRPNPIGDYQ